MSRTIRFTAKDVGSDESEFALTVGFARDSSDERTDDGLILERAKEDNPDDDGIYVEVPIQRYACRGGIKDARLSGDRFSISFTAEAGRRLGDISAMEITFEISSSDFEKTAAMLTRIFRDHETLTIQKE